MKRISALLRLAILMSCSSISIPFVSAQTTLYVDSSAAPGGNGNSWANAMTSLADAVLRADTSWSIDTILIAKGTYYPEYIVPATSATTDRDKSFYFLRDRLTLIGGYPNGGGVRSLQYNPVILSGDIGIRGDSSDNAYHVMLIIGDSTDAGGIGGNGGIDSAGGTGGIGGNGGVDSTSGMGGNAGVGDIGGNGGIDSGMGGNAGAGGPGGIGGKGGVDSTGGTGGIGGNAGTGGIENDSIITVIDSTLYFDGLTVTGGNADGMVAIAVNGTLVPRKFGAGIYNNNYASPVFVNCTVTGNSASLAGSNAGYGGGMYNDNHSSPSLINCTLSGNKASWGGGMYNYDYSDPSLLNCIFSGNYAAALGGGMVNSFNCSPAIVNCLFAGNAGASVSGMFNYNNSSPMLLNVTISGNKADADGSSMENAASSSPVITNSICYGNSSGITNDDAGSIPLITYSLVQGSADTVNGNIDESTNPVFVEPISYTAAPTIAGDYHLQSISVLVDKGNNAAVPLGDTTDLDGYPRIANDTVDLGAYEYRALVCPGFSTIYVDSAADIAGDGSSWGNAMTSLADAIRLARGCPGIDSILIAKGTYYPEYKPLVDTPISNRDRNFCFFRSGLAVAGGYPNGGGARNPQYNPVILSGDIGIRGDSTDNAYHVILIIGDSTNTIDSTLYFDGLTVTGGNANGMVSIAVNGILVSRKFGAGIHNNNYASPTFANCTITGNNASLAGSNAGYGGGMYNDNHSSPSLVNCAFTGNKASWAGGIYNYDYSDPSLLNCIFSGNYAAALGGGMVNSFNCSPAIVNCLFTGNAGASVSGMFNYNNSSPMLINVTMSGNKADADGSSMENTASSSPVITNSICYGNSSGITNDDAGSIPLITYSLIQGSADTANGNIAGSINPLFTTSEAYINAPTTEGDYHLQNISLLINKGNNAIVPAGDTIDLAGNPRIVNDTVDIGAYEYLSNVPLPLGLLSFEAAPADDCKALVSWQTANEQSIAQFVVEQSADAVTYIAVASQMPANTTEGKAYQLLIPMSGAVNYFRLKIREKDGSYTYSKVAGVASHCDANDIRVYPNPVQSTLYIKHSVQGMRYMVLDFKGDILMQGSLEHNITAIPVTGLRQGTYLLRITAENGTGGQAFKFIRL